MPPCLVVFVTDVADGEGGEGVQGLRAAGVEVRLRRMRKEDVQEIQDAVQKFYVCTSVPMRKLVEEWLPGRKLIYEDFNF